MVQSVELLLDAEGDGDVRRDWQRLLAAGLPSQGRIAAPTNRPHVTLAVVERLSRDAEQRLAATAAEWGGALPMPLVLGGLVIFPGRRTILARAVAPTLDLLRVQQAVAAVIAGEAPVQDTMCPGGWTPHVTLARGLAGSELAAAVELVGRRRTVATAVAIRRWDGSGRREWIIAGQSAAEVTTEGSTGG